MLFKKKDNSGKQNLIKDYLRSKTFQRLFIGVITLVLSAAIIESGAIPKKYTLELGRVSQYDITAPRDIENTVKTKQNAEAEANAVPAVMKRLDNVPIEVLNTSDDLNMYMETEKKNVEQELIDQGITKKSKNYTQKLQTAQASAAKRLYEDIKNLRIPLSEEQVGYLIAKTSDDELKKFKMTLRELVSNKMMEEVTDSNLAAKTDAAQNDFQNTDMKQDLKNIGGLILKAVLKPNSVVDTSLTKSKRDEAYKNAMKNKEVIKKDSRIISFGDMVTEDKLQMLKDLSLLETGRFDFIFAFGILMILMLLAFLLVLYMNKFCKNILNNINDLMALSIIITVTLLIARFVYIYTPLLIPVFASIMLVSILLDLKLAIVLNFILAISISLITKGDVTFIYMSIISGTFSAFLVSKANQRSSLPVNGLIIAGMNTLIIISMGIVNKNSLNVIANDSLMVSINGIASIILMIGTLPFWESVFNIITPLKLIELANPNQPLIKRLLMEAPGTYHHSLMVGNLAEVATEAIGGNAMLARVGAYYHDIGKVKRPNFFKENQLSGNPHDRMTANLSTLVITSHTQDGVEIAGKHKIPAVIKEIISQHHGTTLVAYFYHKARKGEKGDLVKSEDFRYQGSRPTSREAGIVMLADSVEAAVRSMADKTEGKIEGLVRKLIKDKLEDGQLDLCNLTLKDLDDIAKGFMKVFSGFFHEREEYPRVNEAEYMNGGQRPSVHNGQRQSAAEEIPADEDYN